MVPCASDNPVPGGWALGGRTRGGGACAADGLPLGYTPNWLIRSVHSPSALLRPSSSAAAGESTVWAGWIGGAGGRTAVCFPVRRPRWRCAVPELWVCPEI